MLEIKPTGKVLGATVHGLDLSRPLDERSFAAVLSALGEHGVLCFPRQTLDAAALSTSAAPRTTERRLRERAQVSTGAAPAARSAG